MLRAAGRPKTLSPQDFWDIPTTDRIERSSLVRDRCYECDDPIRISPADYWNDDGTKRQNECQSCKPETEKASGSIILENARNSR